MSRPAGAPAIRPFRDGEEAAINDTFNQVFGASRPLEEWRWKFPAGPFGRFIMLAVEEDGSIAAQYAAVPVRLVKGGLEVTAGQIVDVFSHPGARRGLGAARLFVRTYDTFVSTWCTSETLAVCYGFPGTRALGLGLARLSYDDVPPQEVPYMGRQVTRRRWRWLPGRHRVRIGYQRDAVSDLWRRCRPRYHVSAVRDAAWFERRFAGRPGVEYTHLSVWRGGAPRAWAVVRQMGAALRWAELLWDGADGGELAALARAVERHAERVGASLAELWLGGDGEATSVLAASGWAAGRQPDDLHLIVRIFHPDFSVEDFPAKLYLTMGDADLV